MTYDVTDQLKRGANAVGVILGNGWFNGHTKAVWNFHEAPWRAAPKLLLHLRVDYTDGRSEIIVSDESWQSSTGPIVFDSIYGGETYDARLEKTGWASASFDASGWEAVKVVEAPSGKLAAQMMPSIKVHEVLKPVKITEPKPGVFIVDVGQNLAGMAELRVKGPAGTRVQMRYGELSPPLRRPEALRGLPHHPRQRWHRKDRPQRLGAVEVQDRGWHHRHRLLLCGHEDRRPGRRTARQKGRRPEIHRAGRRYPGRFQQEVLSRRHGPLRQRQPDRAQLRALPGAGGTG